MLGDIAIIIGSLLIAGLPIAIILGLDYRRQCRAEDEARRLHASGHLARSL